MYESPNPLTGEVSRVKAPADGYVVFNQNAAMFVSDDQLAAIDASRERLPQDDSQQTLPTVEDYMPVKPIGRVYSCDCKGKSYTSSEYTKWMDTMSSTEGPKEGVHFKQNHGQVVPMSFPKGWASGVCHDCGKTISAVDSDSFPSDSGGQDG